MKSSVIQKWISPSRMAQRLRRIQIDNIWLKLLSISLAILLFFLSLQPTSNVRMSGVRLEFTGLGTGIEISSGLEQTVSVRLRGPRDVLRSLTPNQLSVIADLTNKEPGERVVQLRPENVSRPDNIEVLRIEPASIRLKLEQAVRKQVKVEPQYMGQVAPGMEIYQVQVDPPMVEVEGPESQADQVKYVLTETINLTGQKDDFRVAVEVETPHNSLRVKTPGPVNLTIDVGERRTSRLFKNIPVQWLDQQPADRLLTKSIEVELFGPRSAIDAMRDQDLKVEIRTAGLPANAGAIQALVHLPENASKYIEIKKIIPKEVRFKRQ